MQLCGRGGGLLGLCLCAFSETVSELSLHGLHVSHSAGTRSVSTDSLLPPVVRSLTCVRVTTGGAGGLLDVV